MSDSIQSAIAAGIDALGIEVAADTALRLAAYLRLLDKWNRVYNLTAVRRIDEMIGVHVLDSLAVLPHVRGSRLLDIGTGPGLPGIPLALAMPQLSVQLLDSNHKKTRFILQALTELGLNNAEVTRARAEDYSVPVAFDTVVSRAFGSLSEFVAAASHLCAPHGRLLAMKGRRPEDELSALPAGFAVEDIAPLNPPGITGERCVVILRPAGAAGIS